MDHGSLFHVQKLCSPTTRTWVVLTEVISCGVLQLPHKNHKFYKYIFYFLFDVSITNAFILWKNFGSSSRMTLKEFRLRLAEQLIGDYCSHRRAGRGGGAICPLPLQHFPLQSPRLHHYCARCFECRNKRTDTTWFCRECNVWLCHCGIPTADCFLLWHKNRIGQEDYV